MQNIKTVAYVIVEILKIWYFGSLWACVGMSTMPTKNMAFFLELLRNLTYTQKIKTIAYIIVEMLKIC